jgi:spore maturation protein A
MSVIWVLLLVASVVVAAVTGRVATLPGTIAESAAHAVTLSLGLVGVLALWMGLMKVAEAAGVVRAVGRIARPLLRRLFPSVPDDSPAMGAMVMNISANMLGLGNAATPFGIRAMEELERTNPHPGTATDAQALFAALNTASVQLVPATVIALRASAGARQPADILGATLLASACATVAAVISSATLRRLFPAPVPGPRPRGEGGLSGTTGTMETRGIEFTGTASGDGRD